MPKQMDNEVNKITAENFSTKKGTVLLLLKEAIENRKRNAAA
jgi:hypothetical protein